MGLAQHGTCSRRHGVTADERVVPKSVSCVRNDAEPPGSLADRESRGQEKTGGLWECRPVGELDLSLERASAE